VKKGQCFGLLGVLATMCMASAQAQEVGTGTNVPDGQTTSPVQSTRLSTESASPESEALKVVPDAKLTQIFYNVSKCALERDRLAVERLFAQAVISEAKSGAAFQRARSALGRCLSKHGGGEMRSNIGLFMGAWAQELYLRNYAELPAIYQEPFEFAEEGQRSLEDLVIRKFAHCLVQKASSNVDNLVRTSVGSSHEAKSFSALSPYYSGCLSTEHRVATNRFTLRLMLADVLYRRAKIATQMNEASR